MPKRNLPKNARCQVERGRQDDVDHNQHDHARPISVDHARLHQCGQNDEQQDDTIKVDEIGKIRLAAF